ncbi:hypothetical protein Q9233_010457, partial [Columba guinea]
EILTRGLRWRRGWTLPGTLWCGAGTSAGSASELGVRGQAHPILLAGPCSPALPSDLFRGSDRCCRDHDQCSAQITALQLNYGIRNYRLRTVSHFDARFRRCLPALNDTISNIIGVTSFNLLEVPCFVLEECEEPRVCRCYKYLDKCKHQIVPHEVKHELHNVDTQALFHCNCTRRLCFSFSCITVARAVLVHVKHLRKTMRHWGPPHVMSRDKHPDWNTQDSGGTLYEQCLQLALEQKPSAWPRAVP